MKATLILATISAALAFPAYADDMQSTSDQPVANPDLGQQTEPYEKALELMEKEAEKPSWEWDDYDCGSFPEYGV